MTSKARAAVREDAPATEEQPAEAAPTADWKTTYTDCVIADGSPHLGRAVPGTRVCSRHTIRYRNDGTPRQ